MPAISFLQYCMEHDSAKYRHEDKTFRARKGPRLAPWHRAVRARPELTLTLRGPHVGLQ
jgi:hypothetical protein